MFAAKDVPLELLAKIKDSEEQHRPDWSSVVNAVSGPLETYDYYFKFVVDRIESMKTLWIK